MPSDQYRKTPGRKLGILAGWGQFTLKKDFSVSDEELLNS